METLHKRVAGIDVHRMKHVVTTLIEDEAGSIGKQTREFGGFKRDLKFRHVQLGEELRCSILANNQQVMLDL
jgi:hypothetical protein